MQHFRLRSCLASFENPEADLVWRLCNVHLQVPAASRNVECRREKGKSWDIGAEMLTDSRLSQVYVQNVRRITDWACVALPISEDQDVLGRPKLLFCLPRWIIHRWLLICDRLLLSCHHCTAVESTRISDAVFVFRFLCRLERIIIEAFYKLYCERCIRICILDLPYLWNMLLIKPTTLVHPLSDRLEQSVNILTVRANTCSEV